jgi:hypothetical protein
LNEYWYNSKATKIKTLPSRFYMHYYKRNYYSHQALGIEHNFLIRHRTGEYFPLKTWYLSYNNWIIIVMHWFKPNKKRMRLNPMVDHNYLLFKNNTLENRSNSHKLKNKRSILNFVYIKNNFKPIKYSF